MRRGIAIVVPLLLLAALAAPLAQADHEAPRRSRDSSPDEAQSRPPPEVVEETPPPSIPDRPLRRAPSADGTPLVVLRDQLDGVAPGFGLVTVGLVGLGLLAFALVTAQRALRPKPIRPPRRSFEAGRAKGVREGMRHDPLAALAKSGLGEAQVMPRGVGYAVTLHRARGTKCEYASGYLAGLFEGAWAEDVLVVHTACAGKDRKAACVFVVERAVRRLPTRASGPTEASWIRG